MSTDRKLIAPTDFTVSEASEKAIPGHSGRCILSQSHKNNQNMSEIARLRCALLELLAEHQHSQALPTSARFLFYFF